MKNHPRFKCPNCGGEHLAITQPGYIHLTWDGEEWEADGRFFVEGCKGNHTHFCLKCGMTPPPEAVKDFPSPVEDAPVFH